MTIQALSFYVFAFALIASALGVITMRNAVHSVLLLVLAFFSASALWLLLFAEFLAITLVLVYVGAVMVLFLFVVMMLDINFAKLREGFWKYMPLAATVAIAMVVQMALLLTSKQMGATTMITSAKVVANAANLSNTKELGRVLYTQYLLPFELAAVILLVAIVAAIALTLRAKREAKSQIVGDQVRVKSGDRLKIIKMDAVKETPETPTGADLATNPTTTDAEKKA
jgi:NADH-quinone oxidoreductase subunit J